MRKHFILICLIIFLLGLFSIKTIASSTIATFNDPSKTSNDPLFTVDFVNHSVTGGWAFGKTGLTLDIPYNSTNFTNVWFDMTPVTILDQFGNTGPGTIRFFQSGDTVDPLIAINFSSGYISSFGFGADGFISENLTITGSQITDPLSEQEFSFAFGNKKKLPDYLNTNYGFTSTAAFTSSATVNIIPEPSMMAMLMFGILLIKRQS
jgi:hypothetical protein